MSKTSNREQFKDIFKIGDIFILALIIVLVVLTIVFALKDGADTAEIYIDGDLKYTLDLSVDKEIELLEGKMKIVVSEGRIYVKHSDCAEQLCVHSTPLSSHGGVIVCLPNKVVIKVATREVDAIT